MDLGSLIFSAIFLGIAIIGAGLVIIGIVSIKAKKFFAGSPRVPGRDVVLVKRPISLFFSIFSLILGIFLFIFGIFGTYGLFIEFLSKNKPFSLFGIIFLLIILGVDYFFVFFIKGIIKQYLI